MTFNLSNNDMLIGEGQVNTQGSEITQGIVMNNTLTDGSAELTLSNF